MRRFLHNYGPYLLLLLVAVSWLTFYLGWYPYHFYHQEQNQLFLWSADYLCDYYKGAGWLARLAGDCLTQLYYYMYIGPIITSLCLFLLGWLTMRLFCRLRLNRWIAVAFAVGVMMLVGLLHCHHAYRLSTTLSIIGWMMVAWGCSQRTVKRLIICLVLLPLTYWLMSIPEMKKPRQPDMVLEKNFAVDSEYYFGHYDRVIQMVEESDGWTQEMLFFYNLAQAQRGELPDHLLNFTPNQLGTFYKIGPEAPLLTIRNMNELYWALGDMTFTERAAMMTNVFSRENRNVRMIRRLAETNIVSGDSLAAEKYLRLLDKTLVYRRWAENVRKNGERIYARKRALVNHRDTISVSDNAHFLMMQLLDAHPENTIALDYILCSDLLLKDIQNFKRDYDRYCMGTDEALPADVRQHCQPRLKTLYQEALCIWLAGTNAPQEEWQRYIKRQDVLQRFFGYNRQRGSTAFRNTYWYYFDKIKAPEI